MAPRATSNAIFWTQEECLRALYAWVREHGRVPAEWKGAGPNHPAGITVRRHFGSWSRFVMVAGYDVNRAGMKPRWTRELVVDSLLEEFFATGRWPTVTLIRSRVTAPGRPSLSTIHKLFGSFTAAKRAAGWDARCRQCSRSLPRKARAYQSFCSVTCRHRFDRARKRVAAPVVESAACTPVQDTRDAVTATPGGRPPLSTREAATAAEEARAA